MASIYHFNLNGNWFFCVFAFQCADLLRLFRFVSRIYWMTVHKIAFIANFSSFFFSLTFFDVLCKKMNEKKTNSIIERRRFLSHAEFIFIILWWYFLLTLQIKVFDFFSLLVFQEHSFFIIIFVFLCLLFDKGKRQDKWFLAPNGNLQIFLSCSSHKTSASINHLAKSAWL